MNAAAAAFDAVAPDFDRRFGPWLSVAAQRAAVLTELLRSFAPGARVLEIGGGTGEDAAWLAARGRRVTLTDASPAMIAVARPKLRRFPALTEAHVVAAEDLGDWASRETTSDGFDGAFSNFAALNCVTDLRPVARGLARLLRPGAPALLVLFGTACPAEVVVQLLHREPRAALRRFNRGAAAARLGGRQFTVRYHRSRDIARAFAPWFRLEQRRGIGVFVPPSAAETWISQHPRLLGTLAWLDRSFGAYLAPLGDHVLYRLVRTRQPLAMTAAPPPAREAWGR